MKTIKPLSENPSKQEEIDFLQAVRASLPTGSYLSSFLSEQMMGAVERLIKDDWCTDIYADLLFERERVSEARKDLAAARTQYEAAITALKARLDSEIEKVDFWSKANEANKVLLQQSREARDGLYEDVLIAENKLDRIKGITLKAWLNSTPIDCIELRDILVNG